MPQLVQDGGLRGWRHGDGVEGLHRPRVSAALREDERVTPLELFFDLVFVLALTQCTTLMSHDPTWDGAAQGMLVLGVLWWSWVGYAWLTSVVDPEEGAVRLVIFAAMAAFLIAAICVPEAFGDLGARPSPSPTASSAPPTSPCSCSPAATIPALRQLRPAASRSARRSASACWSPRRSLDGVAQSGLWALALLLDMAGPYFFGAEGWKLVPGHFAERHGLIIIIALGESIVAIGVGAQVARSRSGIGGGRRARHRRRRGALVDLLRRRRDRLRAAPDRRARRARERNEIARDSYSYIHFLMVAGIVLGRARAEEDAGDVEDPLELVPAFALLGGMAFYLLGHVAFRYRHVHTINRQRVLLSVVLLALLPVAVEVSALATLAVMSAAAVGR